MDKIIIELFPKTKDAILINKYTEKIIYNDIFKIILKKHKKSIINICRKLKEQEEELIRQYEESNHIPY